MAGTHSTKTHRITSDYSKSFSSPIFIFVADYSTMDIMVMIILGIVGGVMTATVAVCGIYYSYRTKKDQEKEKTATKVAASTPARRSDRTESEPYVVYHDESLVDFDSIPVQPETKRPIRYLKHFSLLFCKSYCAYSMALHSHG